ncbi:MAG: hypothetical protein JNG83_14500 [Opitutaceae bacterium]|nr:hypothetical protein [Opitutaceae bacterium]
MSPSRVRRKLATQEVILCAKTSYHLPDVAEMFGRAGFDGIWICLEHKRSDPAAVLALIQACRLGGADAIMRVKPANYTDILWMLEAGARGLMLPRVRSVDEVREVVDLMKFPPAGRRGLDGIGAEADFGRLPVPAYVAEANRESFLVVQIEEPEVVPHIDAIAALPGADILFVGPGDLTLALGKFGQTDDPEVVAILRRVAEACQRHGKVAAIPCLPGQVAKYREMGYRFFNVISDYRCVSAGLKQTETDLAALGLPLRANP